MLQLLSAQLRRHEHSAQGVAVERSFAQYAAFAFVWAFGGELRPAARERFEAAVMSYVKQLSPDFPTTDGTTMFDHYPDGRGGYLRFRAQPPQRATVLLPTVGQLAVLVPTAEVEAVGHLLQLLIAQGGSVLLSGEVSTATCACACASPATITSASAPLCSLPPSSKKNNWKSSSSV